MSHNKNQNQAKQWMQKTAKLQLYAMVQKQNLLSQSIMQLRVLVMMKNKTDGKKNKKARNTKTKNRQNSKSIITMEQKESRMKTPKKINNKEKMKKKIMMKMKMNMMTVKKIWKETSMNQMMVIICNRTQKKIQYKMMKTLIRNLKNCPVILIIKRNLVILVKINIDYFQQKYVFILQNLHQKIETNQSSKPNISRKNSNNFQVDDDDDNIYKSTHKNQRVGSLSQTSKNFKLQNNSEIQTNQANNSESLQKQQYDKNLKTSNKQSEKDIQEEIEID